VTLPLAVSVGCPSGIGPEVAVAACAALRHRVVLVGDHAQLLAEARRQGVSLERHAVVQPGPALSLRDRKPGRPTAKSGAAQLAWIDAALDLVTAGRARALVTGPVSKDVIATSGVRGSSTFRGHTEHLQRRLRAPEVVMAFWSPKLTTSLVTTHLPLARVPRAIDAEGVSRSTFWLTWLLHRLNGGVPRVVVASLNPHAGEHGLLGKEEERVITPGIASARGRVAEASIPAVLTGPMGAESAFRLAHAGTFDGVVAMYHDQATIPMKLLGFGDAVNVSLGLPIVRTSVDHGTGYDLAGKGRADPRGMVQALRLAHALSKA
jgi:4-phospho-D-threonate 3-dehydrogenase / 4-phospho-D-erythronate 3-dehydrogenase